MFEMVVHAILCCDRIITENNGKKGLIGVFHSFQFPRVPVASPQWFIYGALGSMARGSYEFGISITHGQSSDEVFSRTGEISIRREREDVELVLPVTCTFASFGAHVITLEIGDELVASRILRVSPAVTGTRGSRGNGTAS
jgi:hypothetical protein